jgi:hypothetical protein
VAVVDIDKFEVRNRYPLPEGISFRSLAVGPRTGRLYLFGDRPGKMVESRIGRLRERSAIVTVLDPDGEQMFESQTIRRADGHDWLVSWGALFPDESRLFVSYHGETTTGIDWIEVTPRGLVRCQRRGKVEGGACISSAHGNAEAYKSWLLVATGTPQMEEAGKGGETIRGWDTKLGVETREKFGEDIHLMEFAVDADRLYAIGSCANGGGLSRIDLQTGQVKLLVPTRSVLGSAAQREPAVCGERAEVGPGSLLVVGETGAPVPQPDARGSLLLIDGETGQKIRSVDTPAEPVDVLVASRP